MTIFPTKDKGRVEHKDGNPSKKGRTESEIEQQKR